MVAQIVLGAVLLIVVFTVAISAAFIYFDRQAERGHETELRQLDHTERLVDVAERESSLDGQLDREKER